MFVYYPQGVCSMMMEVELDGDIIKTARITGGCHGNTQAVGRLVEGMKVEDALNKIEGIRCGYKPTSCPDQLAKAIRGAMEAQKAQ